MGIPVPQPRPDPESWPCECPITGVYEGQKLWLLIAGVVNTINPNGWTPNGLYQLPYNGLCQWVREVPFGIGIFNITFSYWENGVYLQSYITPGYLTAFYGHDNKVINFGYNYNPGYWQGGFWMSAWQEGSSEGTGGGEIGGAADSLAKQAATAGINAAYKTFAEMIGVSADGNSRCIRFAQRSTGTCAYIKYKR